MSNERSLSEAEESQIRQAREILFLRHKIQRALLTPSDGSGIKEEEMSLTSRNLCRLEELGRVEAPILKKTKIHKVMKAITKLDPGRIPQEEEYRFGHRARALSVLYAEILAEDAEGKGTHIPEAVDGAWKQTSLGTTVNREPLTDQWVWVDHKDAMGGSKHTITRHPGWDSGLVEGPPERGDETKEAYEARLWKWAKGGGR